MKMKITVLSCAVHRWAGGLLWPHVGRQATILLGRRVPTNPRIHLFLTTQYDFISRLPMLFAFCYYTPAIFGTLIYLFNDPYT